MYTFWSLIEYYEVKNKSVFEWGQMNIQSEVFAKTHLKWIINHLLAYYIEIKYLLFIILQNKD